MRDRSFTLASAALFFCLSGIAGSAPSTPTFSAGITTVNISDDDFTINGGITYPGAQAEGLLMNVRMVNAVFEDTAINTGFNAEANADEFISQIPGYVSNGVRAFGLSLQGGNPGYEGAKNTAVNSNGSLKQSYLDRVERVIRAADQQGAIVILGIYYQRQDQHVADETAIRGGVVNVANWIKSEGFTNVLLEIANEHPHGGFNHPVITSDSGMASLIQLAKQTHPSLKVSASGLGDGVLGGAVASASDYLLIHFNDTSTSDYGSRINALRGYGKPIVVNEDPKEGQGGAQAAQATVDARASWGYFRRANQDYPFAFNGYQDDPVVYDKIRSLTAGGPTPTQITAPAAGTTLSAGQSVTATGTGTNLSWSIDRLSDGLPPFATGTGPSITFTVPSNAVSGQVIEITLTGSAGTVVQNHTVSGSGSGFSAKINFQPFGSPAVAGYTPDHGEAYGARNGMTYGWSGDNRADMRDRNAANSPDQRYDTLSHMQRSGTFTWEIAVPNGDYTVHVVAGDASWFDSVYKINVEGVLTVNGTPSSAVRWIEGTQTVTVVDGRLTVSSASGSANNKICFIDITAAGGAPPPPPPAPLVTIDFVSTGQPYSLAPAEVGGLHYIDRSYTVSSLSADLADGTLLRTANNDKRVTVSAHLRFTVGQPATVFVCYDTRIAPVPGWLSDGTWTATGETFQVSNGDPFRVYSKSVSAGPVTLGGNLASPAAEPPTGHSNYVVVVK